MNRLLVAVIIAEIVAGSAYFSLRKPLQAPPIADLSRVDGIVGDQLRASAEKCKTQSEWRDLGEKYMAMGYFSEAEACHRVAVELDPRNATNTFQWAFALERLGFAGEAAQRFHEAMKLDRSMTPQCRYNAGRCRLRDEQIGPARDEFLAAGDLPMAQYELARMDYRNNDLDVALERTTKILASHPDAAEANGLCQRIAMRRGDSRNEFIYSSRTDLARNRLPNPFDADFKRLSAMRATLGVLGRWKSVEGLLVAGKLREAEPLLRASLASEWHARGADHLAEIELRSGRQDKAIAILQEIVERDGPSFHCLTRLGDAYAEAGKKSDARAAWQRAVAFGSPSDRKDTLYKLAESFKESGDRAKFKEYMNQALVGAGLDQLRQGNLQDAHAAFTEATATDDRHAEAWFQLAEVTRAMGKVVESLGYYRRCLSENPHHGRAKRTLMILESAPK